MTNYFLAIDIGASSGRHILGYVKNGKILLDEVYRFPNNLVRKGELLCWDYDALFGHILEGMKACKAAGKIPVSLGIDTWAVDYVLLDSNGQPIGPFMAYRDGRNESAVPEVSARISEKQLYSLTGIQRQPFNSIYQLWATRREDPARFRRSARFLMTPEYFNYLLTGVDMNEYTNATSTGLVDAQTRTWAPEILGALGYPAHMFGPIHMPGETVGQLRREIAQEVGFNCTVSLVASHDTASAVMAVPLADEHSIYISSGTWSLMGVELNNPITTERSRQYNLTNEGGYNGTYCYLKNIMGLWIIQSIRHELDDRYSYTQLGDLARRNSTFQAVIDANDSRFLAPESMIGAIRDYCRETEQPIPESPGQLMQCAYRGLAKCYAEAAAELQHITGKKYTSINIVGGGCQDSYLNEMTAAATGLPVFAGPVEGTALGNLLCQMIQAGEYADLAQARAAIRESFDILPV